MKVETNSYLQYSNNIQDLKNIDKINSSVSTNKITDEEKKFFAEMYPEKKNEIINYKFYQRNGKVLSVAIGSTFDKKG
ncbi:MAG: hypothetical protein STSR0008_00610 [Ignavibacterium sp.]